MAIYTADRIALLQQMSRSRHSDSDTGKHPRYCSFDTSNLVHGRQYLESNLAQCFIPFSKNKPRLISPMLTIPTSLPLSTTGMRRKFLRPMYEAASRTGSWGV